MTEKGKVLIVDEMHESLLPLLREIGYTPVYMPIIQRDQILEILHTFTGLVIRSKTPVDEALIRTASKLKFVARAGAGLDNLDVKALKEKNIAIINAPEGNMDAVGEHTVGMLLGILHKINHAHQQISEGIWNREDNRGIELKGKVVGIYGVGFMGRAFASKLKGFGCRVIGYDKYRADVASDAIESVSLDELKKQSEILSIHLPLSEETKGLLDEPYLREFSQLKILINTARGKVVKTADLLALLDRGDLYGAALDVLENEKMATYTKEEREMIQRLAQHPHVLLTSHVAGWTFESYERINQVMIEKIKNLFNSDRGIPA